MKISGIVDESDTKKGSIYYNNESVMKELEKMKMFDGRTYLSYLEDNGKLYQTYSDYTQTENSIRLYSDIENIKIYNPLYDERMEFVEEGRSFQHVFNIVNICLFVGLIIFVIIYLNKDSKKMMKICSILVSLQNSVKEMKNIYCKYKILNLIIFIFIETLFISSVIYMMKFDLKEYLVILLGINAIVLIVYSACVYLNAQNLRGEKIADILKNNID